MLSKRLSWMVMLFGIAGLAPACAQGSDDVPTITKPHLMALSTYGASLGTPVDVIMANPPPVNARRVELVFDGTFTYPDGRTAEVHTTQGTTRTETGTVRWTTFGPFTHPFVPQDPDVGTFRGKAGIKVTYEDGTTSIDERPVPIHFDVKPSIIVTELQPTTADCAAPALRLIGAMSYKLKAKAIGFQPTSIEYAFETPDVTPDATGLPVMGTEQDGSPKYRMTRLAHAMSGNTMDVIDGDEVLVLPPVPMDRPTYGVVFGIVARDATGQTVTSTFGMTAHKPLEVYYDGRVQLAQIYPAKPVSGCMPGGQQGRRVLYLESDTETRQKQVSLTLASNWMQGEENHWETSDGKTVTASTTQTDGFTRTHGTTNSFTFTKDHGTSQGVNWADNITNTLTATVGGKTGGFLAEGSWSVSDALAYGHTWGGDRKEEFKTSEGNTQSTLDQEAVNHSDATTDSTAVTHTDSTGGNKTSQRGGSETTGESWTVSSSQTIQQNFEGAIIANTQGVFYRQMSRYTYRAFVLEFNKCGEGDVIGDVTLQDYIWAPDLALSERCPPLPQSNLPKPQCLVPPCDP